MNLYKILEGNRVTLPEDWLKHNQLQAGDYVAIAHDNGSIRLTITAVDIVPREPKK